MKKIIETPIGSVRIGTKIRIEEMHAETAVSPAFPDGIDHQAEALNGKTGIVTSIDDAGQLHGDWGGLAVIPGEDRFSILPVVFIVSGSLSAIQEIETDDLDEIVSSSSEEDALAFLEKIAEKNGVDWDYDLDVKKVAFGSMSEYESYMEGYEEAFDSQEDSGNCQGWFTIGR